MANRLEEVCLDNKYEGTLKSALAGVPYLRVQTGTDANPTFKTASTLDGHRFASDFLAKGTAAFAPDATATTLAEHVKTSLGMTADGKTMPIARVPDAFPLVMGLDTMSLIHGFQISNAQISFVGLRLPRALTASVVGLNCQRVTVPGVKFNVGQVESESGQAIFQKQRITARSVQARFSIDAGLLSSLRLDTLGERGAVGECQNARLKLLLAIALWKVASFLDLLSVELSLRTECKLRLKSGDNGDVVAPEAKCEGGRLLEKAVTFPFASIAKEEFAELISSANLPQGRSPLTLQFQ